jgi:hypothetical protein
MYLVRQIENVPVARLASQEVFLLRTQRRADARTGPSKQLFKFVYIRAQQLNAYVIPVVQFLVVISTAPREASHRILSYFLIKWALALLVNGILLS